MMQSLAPIAGRLLRSSCCQRSVTIVRLRHSAEEHRSSWFLKPLRQPPNTKLVYLGPKNNLVGSIKAFSLTSTLIGLSLQCYVLATGKGEATDLVMVAGLGLFAFTPLLLHLLTSSYVFWLFASEDGRFVALTKSIFLYNRSIEFRQDQVKLTETGIPFANLQANGKKLFIDPAFSLDLGAVEKLFRHKQQ